MSRRPLAPRNEVTLNANPTATTRRVMALSNYETSNNAQGNNSFDNYLNEFWPYIDTLVFWSSSSTGVISAPTAYVTDAAHQNGVPVPGTVFLPPNVYGGDIAWTRDLVKRDPTNSAVFPVADKMIQVARTYGFDGWFINAETSGADATVARDMQDFVTYLRASGLQVIWYDSMVESGSITWQGALNSANDAFLQQGATRIASQMFLDFRWTAASLSSSATFAQNPGRPPGELFAGIDVEANTDSSATAGKLASVAGTPLNIGLYRPDFVFNKTADKTTYPARDRQFWSGSDGDPSVNGGTFPGLSASVAPRSALRTLPFSTTVNPGRGHAWFQQGARQTTGDWTNLSVQDLAPTWQWIVRGSPLNVTYDYDAAFQGGASLNLTGTLAQTTTVPLYAASLPLPSDARLSVTSRYVATPNGGTLSALLTFSDGTAATLDLTPGTSWTTRDVSLSTYAGRTLTSIALQLGGSSTLALNVGRLAVGSSSGAPTPPSNVTNESGRIRWVSSPASTVWRYDVEAVTPTGPVWRLYSVPGLAGGRTGMTGA